MPGNDGKVRRRLPISQNINELIDSNFLSKFVVCISDSYCYSMSILFKAVSFSHFYHIYTICWLPCLTTL